MASGSPLVQRCLVTEQSHGTTDSNILATLYVPQLERLVISALTAVSVSALVSAAGQTAIKTQIALAAGDAT